VGSNSLLKSVKASKKSKKLSKFCEHRCQFHQHFTQDFCANIFAAKKFQSQNVTREKMGKALSYEKFLRKMLMKLTSGRYVFSS